MPVTYVGHPLAEMIPLQPDEAAARAQRWACRTMRNVVTLMPGSRMGELKYNTVAFRRRRASCCWRATARLRFVAPMAGERQRAVLPAADRAKPACRTSRSLLTDGGSHTAICAADAVLVASGTASLEVALFKKPMVIAYKMMRASWQIMRHMGYQPWIGLPNILARDFLVPELLQNAASAASAGRRHVAAAERRAAAACAWCSASRTCTTACCATARRRAPMPSCTSLPSTASTHRTIAVQPKIQREKYLSRPV